MRITDFPELIAPTGNDLLVTVDIANDLTKKVKLDNLPISLPALTALATKQATLVSGTNIKTLNSVSLLGSGDIVLAATPSGVAGAIQFSDGSAFSSDASNFFWDDTNNRLGVGTNSPLCGLDVSQNINGDVFARLRNTNAGGFGMLLNAGSGVGTYAMQWANYQGSGGGRLYPEGVYIGQQSAPTARLQVRGSGSTSATTSLLVQNSAGSNAFRVLDDGAVQVSEFIRPTDGTTNSFLRLSNATGTTMQYSGGFVRLSPNFTFGSTTLGTILEMSSTTGKFLLGGGTQDASSKMQLNSTTEGFLPPRMTTTQKNAIATPAAGLVVYDSTTNKLCCYNGSTWNDLF